MLHVKESYVNVTKGYRFGDSEWYEPWTDNKKRLFRDYQKEFGRCVSKIYITLPIGDGTYRDYAIGWVFSKTLQYEDCKDKYVREVWVEFREKKDK